MGSSTILIKDVPEILAEFPKRKKKIIIVRFLSKKSKERVHERIQEESKQIMDQVQRLRDHLHSIQVKHNDEILKQPTLKDAHIYCVLQGISAQQYGPLIEQYIIHIFGYKKRNAGDCVGDCSKEREGICENVEIKASLGGSTHTKFNYVQIRLSQNIDYYLLTAYHLIPTNVDESGVLYIFRVPKEEMKALILQYGGYAHGTIKERGKITIDSINCKDGPIREYAIRPQYGDKCWNTLLQYKCTESDL